MRDLEIISQNIKEKIFDFLSGIQTSKHIKFDVYNEIINELNELCIISKDCDMTSKSLLSDIYFTMKIIRAESCYFPEKEQITLGKMADEIQLNLELFLKNDLKSSRKPGVPRII